MSRLNYSSMIYRQFRYNSTSIDLHIWYFYIEVKKNHNCKWIFKPFPPISHLSHSFLCTYFNCSPLRLLRSSIMLFNPYCMASTLLTEIRGMVPEAFYLLHPIYLYIMIHKVVIIYPVRYGRDAIMYLTTINGDTYIIVVRQTSMTVNFFFSNLSTKDLCMIDLLFHEVENKI